MIFGFFCDFNVCVVCFSVFVVFGRVFARVFYVNALYVCFVFSFLGGEFCVVVCVCYCLCLSFVCVCV